MTKKCHVLQVLNLETFNLTSVQVLRWPRDLLDLSWSRFNLGLLRCTGGFSFKTLYVVLCIFQLCCTGAGQVTTRWRMWRPAPAAAAASPGTAWWTTSGTSTFSTHTHRESEWLYLLSTILSCLTALHHKPRTSLISVSS